MAAALWVKTIRRHRTDRQATVPCSRSDVHGALREACHELDLPEPVWLEKNEREWVEFGMTRFLPRSSKRSSLNGWRSNISIRTRRKGKAGTPGTRTDSGLENILLKI